MMHVPSISLVLLPIVCFETIDADHMETATPFAKRLRYLPMYGTEHRRHHSTSMDPHDLFRMGNTLRRISSFGSIKRVPAARPQGGAAQARPQGARAQASARSQTGTAKARPQGGSSQARTQAKPGSQGRAQNRAGRVGRRK